MTPPSLSRLRRPRAYGIMMIAIWQEAAWEQSSDIVRTLGGPRLVPARTPEELRDALRAGLPYGSLAAVATGFSIDGSAIVAILRIPQRTLARRKKERRLTAEESDRLFRLGRVAALAEEVLGSRAKATAWLHAENRALGGAPPSPARHRPRRRRGGGGAPAPGPWRRRIEP